MRDKQLAIQLAQVECKLADAVRRNDANDWHIWHRCYNEMLRIEREAK